MSVWEKDHVVEDYASNKFIDLQKPEKVVYTFIEDFLSEWEMLDLGVGGGRTTFHFANIVKSYTGVDISHNMIKKCKEKYGEEDNKHFFVTSATDLSLFSNDSFDFVLFSFNGIDYVNHKERMKIFSEIKRVLKPGGYFLFSSHNYNAIDDLFDLGQQGLWFYLNMILRNLFVFTNEKYVIINDGAHDFGLKTYYVDMNEQIDKLVEFGFDDVRLFDLNGKELNEPKLEMDSWIYYFCRKAK